MLADIILRPKGGFAHPNVIELVTEWISWGCLPRNLLSLQHIRRKWLSVGCLSVVLPLSVFSVCPLAVWCPVLCQSSFLPLNIPCLSAIHLLFVCCLSAVCQLSIICHSVACLLSIYCPSPLWLLSVHCLSSVNLSLVHCPSPAVHWLSVSWNSIGFPSVHCLPSVSPLYIRCPSTCPYSFHIINDCQTLSVQFLCLLSVCWVSAWLLPRSCLATVHLLSFLSFFTLHLLSICYPFVVRIASFPAIFCDFVDQVQVQGGTFKLL